MKRFSLFLLALVSWLLIPGFLQADCTVYYAGSYSTPYVYAWTGSSSNHAWPGVAMTATSYTYGGQTVYSYTMSTSYANCIFNNNGTGQSSDLTTQCSSIYYNDEWISYTPGDTASSVTPTPITPTAGTGVPSESEDVLLQGFYWDSYNVTTYGRTKWIDFNNNGYPAQIGQAGFTMVWLPSPARAEGLGYHPQQWSSLDGGLGTSGNLKTLVTNLHNNGVKVIADIVVNHRQSTSGWCGFTADNFGSAYGSTSAPDGKYQFTTQHICSDDEAFTDKSSSCYNTDSASRGAKDSGVELYAAARDLDHTNSYVRDAIKSYLAFLQGTVGFDGWRYDLVKSYAPKYLGEYNTSSNPYFSVAEYYQGDTTALKAYVKNTGYKTMVFDFATKFALFQGTTNSIGNSSNGGYAKLLQSSRGNMLIKCPGYSKYAVTFIDNHDTFERSDAQSNEYISYNADLSTDAVKNRILESNAYILSMPGIPCVFWPHWHSYQTEINQLIAARKLVGIHSESQILEEAGQNGVSKGYYQAKVQGHKGTLVLQIGMAGALSSLSAPEGYTLYTSGTKYKVYVKVDGTSLEDTQAIVPAQKVFENGQLYIYKAGHKYTTGGQLVK